MSQSSTEFDSCFLDELINDFDREWRDGTEPQILVFLERMQPADEETRLELLTELVAIDIEWRWRTLSASADTWVEPACVETYCRRFPELLLADHQRLELIAVEYRVRRDWGDGPGHAEFVKRFPGLRETLTERLRSVDLARASEKAVVEAAPAGLPDRYLVQERLGSGGFGSVWLAHDAELGRDVAIKLPLREGGRPDLVDACVREGRTLAALNHPNIVPVFDIGRTATSVFIVSPVIDGGSLRDARERLVAEWDAIARVVIEVSDALSHAHAVAICHRDVKPTNILISDSGTAFLADFGLAMTEEDRFRTARFVGTPAYMSPEQARSEAHRVDGRSDIFSLGVVFYELLCQRRPFQGQTTREILLAIKHDEPRPPRQVDASIPRELERICLKMLSKRVAERYATASDIAVELQEWLGSREPRSATGTSQSSLVVSSLSADPPAVVPRGLRAFDTEDASFFIRLLPGPVGRGGLPGCVEFWKTRIESFDRSRAFPVGVLYGPSGCGKSSLVRAGVLPSLCHQVTPVCIAAQQSGTSIRLADAVSALVPDVSMADSLASMLHQVRSNANLDRQAKLLLVVDQFEQILHAPEDEQTELLDALRQCDGVSVQALLLVRDDFWLSLCRFMRDLEVDLVPGFNIALADLFDKSHAGRVLTLLGQAYGRLPRSDELSDEQQEFVSGCVDEIAEDGRVVSVRLALLAEMTKARDWNRTTLEEFGGHAGLGSAFLEESFFSRSSLPHHRQHQVAAVNCLRALLPEAGQDIKGGGCTREELLQHSEYAAAPEKLAELLRILDNELRLITPIESGGAEGDQTWQLTHDFLVPSIRAWLEGRDQTTAHGRAQRCLEERASSWSREPTTRFLPSLGEWISISLRTRRSRWSGSQRAMMRVTTRRILRGAMLLVVLISVALVVGRYWLRGQRASNLVDQLAVAKPEDIAGIVRELQPLRARAVPLLRAKWRKTTRDDARLNLSLGLLPDDGNQVAYLRDRLVTASPETFTVLSEALAPRRRELADFFWKLLADDQRSAVERLNAALALARFDSESKAWESQSSTTTRLILDELLSRPGQYPFVLQNCSPIGDRLSESLRTHFDDHSDPRKSALAASLLGDFNAGVSQQLVDLLVTASPDQYRSLYRRVQATRSESVQILKRYAIPTESDSGDQTQVDAAAQKAALAAVTLVRLGEHKTVLPLLKYEPDPRLRTFLIHAAGDYGLPLGQIQTLLDECPGADETQAVLLILAESQEVIAEPHMQTIRQLFVDHPDTGVHSAAELVLRKCGLAKTVAKLPAAGVPTSPAGPSWFRNTEGQTMSIVSSPGVVTLGGRRDDPDRVTKNEPMKVATLDYSFAISTTEVTAKQYGRFYRATRRRPYSYMKQMTTGPDPPAISIRFFSALAYCNWLSQREGLEPFYELNEEGQIGYGSRTHAPASGFGYRLPTSDEWEFACRAGSRTSRYYGYDPGLLRRYAWFRENAGDMTHSVGLLIPNRLGLFDMLGNNQEWCHSERHLKEPFASRGWATVRGGSLRDAAVTLRSSNRNQTPLTAQGSLFGFRIARTINLEAEVVPSPDSERDEPRDRSDRVQ